MRFSILAATLVLTGCTSVQSGLSDFSDRMGSLFAGEASVYEDMDETDVVLAVQAIQLGPSTSRSRTSDGHTEKGYAQRSRFPRVD